jgi:hypothetical protein
LKQSNFIYLSISLLPFLFALAVHNQIIMSPSTHLFGSNPAATVEISREVFIFLTLVCGVAFYFLSIVLAKYLSYIPTKINLVYSRLFINAALALLVFFLVLGNLR